jgi:hypothetical protein
MSGELYHTPAEIIAQMLVDLGIADYPETEDGLTGWTIFPNHLPEYPDQAMSVVDTQGRLHRRIQVSGLIGEHYGIQVLVRSAQDPGTTYTKTKTILHYFDTEVRKEEVTLDNSVYIVHAVTRTSPALPVGKDGARFLHSGNALASIELLEVLTEETGTGS